MQQQQQQQQQWAQLARSTPAEQLCVADKGVQATRLLPSELSREYLVGEGVGFGYYLGVLAGGLDPATRLLPSELSRECLVGEGVGFGYYLGV